MYKLGLVVLLAHIVHGFLDKQPDYVKTCMHKDPNFINCSTHAVQELFNAIPKGEPAIGLEPLDPLYIPKINILQGGGGPVTVNASLSNVTVTGFGKTQILYNDVDRKTYNFLTKMRLEHLRLEENLDIVAKCDVKMEKRDGFHFYNLTGIHIKFSIGGLKLHMGNLFDGIKALEDSTNAYLNANWRPVAESLNPILTKTIEDLMLNILKTIFDNIPADFFLGDLDD